jgi:hypothetical protein
MRSVLRNVRSRSIIFTSAYNRQEVCTYALIRYKPIRYKPCARMLSFATNMCTYALIRYKPSRMEVERHVTNVVHARTHAYRTYAYRTYAYRTATSRDTHTWTHTLQPLQTKQRATYVHTPATASLHPHIRMHRPSDPPTYNPTMLRVHRPTRVLSERTEMRGAKTDSWRRTRCTQPEVPPGYIRMYVGR